MGAEITWNQRVPLRDGVEVSADVYRPAGAERRTTLLARTPYNKNTAIQQQRAELYAEHGYNFVWMDVRGRGDSDGAFVPWRNEGKDGYDNIEWVAAQPWSNGKVVTWGASYVAHNQWMAALHHPPHLTAMIAYVAPSDPFEDNPTGVPTPWEVCWFRMLDGKVLQDVERVDWPKIAWHLPLLTMDERAGFHSDHWRSHLTQPITEALFWDHVRYQPRITEVDVPVLHITGWYDDVQRGTMTNFTSLTGPDAPRSVAQKQWLVVGPWDHRCTNIRERRLGAIDYGDSALMDLPALERAWLAAILDGSPAPPKIRIFAMGQNVWRNEGEWPLARTKWTDFYLASDGHANSRRGDGALRSGTAIDSGTTPDAYEYDPRDPVPFLSNFASSSQIGGPDDYSAIEERPDLLIYSTSPVSEDTEVTGPVRLVLFASSSALDTDFVARLVDVHPDGFAQRICDGLVRARFREGYLVPERHLRPGETVQYEIDMWSTSHTFLRGHVIRLEVTSSAFPRFDRNMNTGGAIATETEAVVAVNTVFHDIERRSRLILPLIPAPSRGVA
ncbi:MAG: CocE/NonD family hydrolase [Candidatus Dormibacteria bacterium]